MGNLRKKFFVHAEVIALLISRLVVVFRLVQSQREARAASTARSEKNANGTGRIAVKIGVQFFFRGVCHCNHQNLQNGFLMVLSFVYTYSASSGNGSTGICQ